MIVTAAVVASVVMLAVALTAILRVDQSPVARAWRCCRCTHTWSSTDRRCPHCAVVLGKPMDAVNVNPRPVHGHDFVGRMDTAEIPVVREEVTR